MAKSKGMAVNILFLLGVNNMGWYKGTYRFSRRSLAQLLAMSNENKKDYYFRVRNKDKADQTVVKFVFSPNVVKDRRSYVRCKLAYEKYKDFCLANKLEPLSSWQFKRNMQLLGFVYQKHHRFYAGYYQNKVTTAYKNIGFKRLS